MINDPRLANIPPPVPAKSSGYRHAIKIVLAVIAILVALLLGLIILFLIGVETGPIALLIGLVAATLPVPIYVTLVLWIDRYESEPFWMLTTAFLWGMLIAPFVALFVNTIGGLVVASVTHSTRAGETFLYVISAPIVEETMKALILFILFFWKKDEFDGVIDGIVYASLVALGFAMTENVLYYGKAIVESGGALTGTFIVRGIFAPFSHPLFTSLTGIGLGLARQTRNSFVKFITPLVGFMAAICMHGIWNGSQVLFGSSAFLLTYVVIMVPAFLVILVVIFLALRREGQLVREFLLTDFQRGLLTPEEYRQLTTIRGRMGASYNAFSRGGYKKWQASKQFNQMASELAFHRSRVSRGIGSADAAAREAAYLQALENLQRSLRQG
jgi:RsiW-degrading membrane proteinase PrsW (M82 family)